MYGISDGYDQLTCCFDRTWHPNIDVETGRVMIPILGKDWRPVLNINTVLFGLQLIFIEPGVEYVLNPLAAQQYHQDPIAFHAEVSASPVEFAVVFC